MVHGDSIELRIAADTVWLRRLHIVRVLRLGIVECRIDSRISIIVVLGEMVVSFRRFFIEVIGGVGGVVRSWVVLTAAAIG